MKRPISPDLRQTEGAVDSSLGGRSVGNAAGKPFVFNRTERGALELQCAAMEAVEV